MLREIGQKHPNLELGRLIGESIRRIITLMVTDLLSETERSLTLNSPACAAEIRGRDQPTAAFSTAMANGIAGLKQFLFGRMYRHPRVLGVMANAQTLLIRVFEALLNDPALLPSDWRSRCGGAGERITARAVCDYMAGMTDRFAAQEYRRIFHTEFPL